MHLGRFVDRPDVHLQAESMGGAQQAAVHHRYPTEPHRHLRGISVCMTEYTLESRILTDGQWTRNERKLGTVYWSEASLHQVRNVGKTMSHTIRIELKY